MSDGTSRSRLARTAWSVGGAIAMLAVIVAFWSLVRWATTAIFGSPARGSAWAWGALDVALAIVLLGLVGRLVGKAFSKSYRHDVIRSVIEAMGRIARGDFSVSVELRKNEQQGPFGGVASSLNEMAESLARLESMRSEFISDVSHEIQSPLTSIIGFATALRSERLSETERSHYLDIIEAESTRLSRLGENLLRLSSLESDAYALCPESFRLDSQLRDVLLAAEPQWRTKDIEVGAALSQIDLVGDRSLLRQVWTNLLHNAVKFTPSRGHIEIEAEIAGDGAIVRFTDSGVGIDAGDLGRLFERFYKADTSRSAAVGGSGLGLSIVKKIVDLHGGQVTAHSEGPGLGATFAVILPLLPPAVLPSGPARID